MSILKIYECLLSLKEDLMFVSTEIGNEYHAYGLIGNTALPYALNLIPVHYRSFNRPMHREHFETLNNQGIYITPATFIGNIAYKMERFNCMPDRYDLSWKDDPSKKGGRKDNYPDEGWWKMIARGSKAVFYLIAESDVILPQYIRVGKFMSKCIVDIEAVSYSQKEDLFSTNIILRAEDIHPTIELLQYEKIPIQNGMYLRNVQFKGKGYEIQSQFFKNVNIPYQSAFYIALGGKN